MNLARKITAIFLVLIMIFSFAACSDETEEQEIDIGTVNIGVITNGDIEKDAYSKMQYDAFRTAYEVAGAGGGQVTEKTSVPVGDSAAMETAISDLIARGCRIIVGTDSGYLEELTAYAQKEENSNIFFISMGDYNTVDPNVENLAVFTVKNYEAEYLEGMTAALSTKTYKIGYVVDKTFAPVQIADVNAFLLGAQSIFAAADVNLKVMLVVTDDVKSGIEKVKANGCDIVYSRNYVVNEEDGKGYFTLPESVNAAMSLNNISTETPEFISAPAYNLEVLYTSVLTNSVNDKFNDIKSRNWNIAEGIVDVRPATNSTVKTAVDAVRDKFLAGKDVIGTDLAKLNSQYLPGIVTL